MKKIKGTELPDHLIPYTVFRTVFEQSPISTQIFDPEGNTILVNNAWEELWNAKFSQIKSYNILQDKQLEETGIITGVRKAFKGEAAFLPVIKYIPSRTIPLPGIAEYRWLSAMIYPVKSSRGNIQAVVLQHRDITELKEMEERKNEFISMASHELKTPVTSLKVFTQVLQRQFEKQGESTSLTYLSRMNSQINKLTRLISDLLDVSKIEAGKLAIKNESFLVSELVVEMVENLQATAQQIIEVRNKERFTVIGDRDRVGQVIINLLSNAIKYSPRTGKIRVTVTNKDGFAYISVKDNGQGIPKEHQKKIFERFYQVPDSGKHTYPGLGMGLYISSEIIKLHNGTMHVESENGKGAKFIFTLPLAA